MVTISSGLRGTNGQPAAPPYNNGPYTWDENLTLSGVNTFSSTAIFSGTAQFDGTKTVNTGQVIRAVVVSTASTAWVADGLLGGYNLAASNTEKQFCFPISALKTGDVITGYNMLGQIESGGNAAVFDSYLRKVVTGTANPVTYFIATATQISVTADERIYRGTASLTQTVNAEEIWYVCGSATTGASTDVWVLGVEVNLNRK